MISKLSLGLYFTQETKTIVFLPFFLFFRLLEIHSFEGDLDNTSYIFHKLCTFV